jgi:hypothetical protein
MWMQTIDGSPLRKITDVVGLVVPGGGRLPYLELTRFSVSTTLPGLPFNEWAMPVAEDLYKLLSNRPGGQDGVEFLARQARISRKLLDASNSHVWIRDTFGCRATRSGWHAHFQLFDLRADAPAADTVINRGCESPVFNDPNVTSGSGQGILFRRVRPGVDYWWG